MLSLKEFALNTEIFVVAHRGSSGTAPENSISAYKEAMESGASMIEVDVQVTKDNQIVAYHDFSPIDSDKEISELNYDDIKNIDIGIGFDEKFANERIPLLEDVLKLIKNKCYLMIEIKTLTGENFAEHCNLLLKLIENYEYKPYTIFGSFNYSALSQIKKFDSSYHTAAIKIPGDKSLPSEIKKITGCVAFICSIEEFDEVIVEDCNKNDIFTGVYSVDTKFHLESAMKYGCKAIATNFPKKIIKLINEIKESK